MHSNLLLAWLATFLELMHRNLLLAWLAAILEKKVANQANSKLWYINYTSYEFKK